MCFTIASINCHYVQETDKTLMSLQNILRTHSSRIVDIVNNIGRKMKVLQRLHKGKL